MTADRSELPPVEAISAAAHELWRARHAGEPRALARIRAHYPFERLRGKTDAEILAEFFTKVDAAQVLSAEHGFGHWGEMMNARERAPAPDFEAAVDAVVDGDLPALEARLAARPELARARSACRHRATLLHYVAANGVEDERQRTPPNAVAIARALLDAGAEVDAIASTYFGGLTNTPLYLLVSSDHPKRAGVQGELTALLLERGAAADGLGGDGLPLSTAIAFQSPDAMAALVRGGASLGAAVHAAAAGDPSDLERCFDGAGLRPAAVGPRNATIDVAEGADDPARRAMDHALVYASMHGRRGAVELLLARGVSPNAEIGLAERGLHWAAFAGHAEVVDVLLAAGADANTRDRRWHSKPIEWADAGGQPELVRMLLRHTELDLVEACAYGDPGRVRALLAAGEAADGVEGTGRPLRNAAAAGHLEIVRDLLDAGADPLRTNPDGKTALDWAEERGHSGVALVLRGAEHS